MKRTVILLVGGLILAGCSAVPLRTLWRLRDFSVQDVVSIDPNELRARIVLPVDVPLKPDSSQIVLELTDDKGHGDSYKFSLETTEQEEATQGLFRKRSVTISTLRLSHEAVSDFVRFQNRLRTKERTHGSASLHVSSAFDRSDPLKNDETPEPFELSILLKLRADEDYFTLIDRARIREFKKDEPEQESSPEGKSDQQRQ
ncbi:MAG: hypothetical protein JW955_13760 [Sedimentisphaerales bacterium]|nr:hypothetical protein [Sedimentisphaerales bacterium]